MLMVSKDAVFSPVEPQNGRCSSALCHNKTVTKQTVPSSKELCGMNAMSWHHIHEIVLDEFPYLPHYSCEKTEIDGSRVRTCLIQELGLNLNPQTQE